MKCVILYMLIFCLMSLVAIQVATHSAELTKDLLQQAIEVFP